MAQLIKYDGTIEDVSPLNGREFTLKELQDFVGGYIERVVLADGQIMFVNENGKLDGLPPNATATVLFRAAWPDFTFSDFIVGNAIVGSPIEMGEDVE